MLGFLVTPLPDFRARLRFPRAEAVANAHA